MNVRFGIVSLASLVLAAQVIAQSPDDSESPWIDAIASAVHDAAARAELQGNWIVRSVERDGKKNPAQVGQEIDDIITMKIEDNRFSLG